MKFKVGVFEDKTGIRAYTMWYNPQWSGCCEHIIEALNGTEAKKKAIGEHKIKCKSIPGRIRVNSD